MTRQSLTVSELINQHSLIATSTWTGQSDYKALHTRYVQLLTGVLSRPYNYSDVSPSSMAWRPVWLNPASVFKQWQLPYDEMLTVARLHKGDLLVRSEYKRCRLYSFVGGDVPLYTTDAFRLSEDVHNGIVPLEVFKHLYNADPIPIDIVKMGKQCNPYTYLTRDGMYIRIYAPGYGFTNGNFVYASSFEGQAHLFQYQLNNYGSSSSERLDDMTVVVVPDANAPSYVTIKTILDKSSDHAVESCASNFLWRCMGCAFSLAISPPPCDNHIKQVDALPHQTQTYSERQLSFEDYLQSIA